MDMGSALQVGIMLSSVLSAGISRSGAVQLSGSDGFNAECHQWKSRSPDRSKNNPGGCKEVRGTEVRDSCIAVIISRPLIRANHLIQKIPLYFDETPRSEPDLNQLVVPVTTLATSRARCHGTETCNT